MIESGICFILRNNNIVDPRDIFLNLLKVVTNMLRESWREWDVITVLLLASVQNGETEIPCDGGVFPRSDAFVEVFWFEGRRESGGAVTLSTWGSSTM